MEVVSRMDGAAWAMATTQTEKKRRGGRAEAGGGRIRAGSGLPGAHFFSSPWLRRMISAELAILAGSGSDSARCLLCPSPATRVRSFHPARAKNTAGF